MEALLKSIERESEDVAKALEAPDGQMVEVVYKANRVDEEVAKPATPNHIPGTALRVGKAFQSNGWSCSKRDARDGVYVPQGSSS